MSTPAVVFDLFHTLVDTEHLRPPAFDEIGRVAEICDVDPVGLREYWDATYIERETTPVDILELVRRHLVSAGIMLTADLRAELDAVFGVCKDDALRFPPESVVTMLRSVTVSTPIGVLSNCHEREVRCWDDSPLAPLVGVFGRSSRIGSMKPDIEAYEWMIRILDADPAASIYVGNGSSDELAGARRAGFGTVIHSNVFDRSNGLVTVVDQRRRAAQADVSVDSVDELGRIFDGLLGR